MTKEIQELDKVVEHPWFFLAFLGSPHCDIVSSEASRFMDVFKRGMY
jgi:hypothetical protein